MPLPEDYKALYWNYNGILPRTRLSQFQESVFLDFCWHPISQIIDVHENKGKVSAYDDPSLTTVFHGICGIYLSLSQRHVQDGEVPLAARWG